MMSWSLERYRDVAPSPNQTKRNMPPQCHIVKLFYLFQAPLWGGRKDSHPTPCKGHPDDRNWPAPSEDPTMHSHSPHSSGGPRGCCDLHSTSYFLLMLSRGLPVATLCLCLTAGVSRPLHLTYPKVVRASCPQLSFPPRAQSPSTGCSWMASCCDSEPGARRGERGMEGDRVRHPVVT